MRDSVGDKNKMGVYDNWERVPYGWIDTVVPNAAPNASVAYYRNNRDFWLPDWALKQAGAPIPIVQANMQIRGYTGPLGGLGGFALDKGMRFIKQTSFPLTQAGDFDTGEDYLIDVDISENATGTETFEEKWAIGETPLYIPGEDAFYFSLAFAGANPPVQVDTQITFLVPPGMSEGFPLSMAPPSPNGNDANTVLMLHATTPSGSVAFQDSSQRNYTMCWAGGVRIAAGGKISFDGTSGMLCPDMAPPGYVFQTPANVLDWNFQSGDFTIDAWAAAVNPNAQGTLVGSGSGRSPFQIFQTGGNLQLWAASQNGTTWDVASGVSLGAVPTGPFHWAIVRSGSSLLGFINGALKATCAIPTGGLCNAISAANGAGRPTFGAQCVLDQYGNLTGTPFYWGGTMWEIRCSNIARWTANFTPLAAYTP
jgi:hypothetical protein